LVFRLGWGRRLSGIALLQRTFGSVPVLILKSLGGFGVSRSNFSNNGPFFGKGRT
jgi:hypothetical protein